MVKKAFNKLQKEWYAKLRRSGFRDIENDRGELLNYSTSRHFENHHRYDMMTNDTKKSLYSLTTQSTETYYILCNHFLHDHSFESSLHRKIWELHCDAISQRIIAETVTTKKMPMTASKVRWIVDNLEKIMLGGLS